MARVATVVGTLVVLSCGRSTSGTGASTKDGGTGSGIFQDCTTFCHAITGVHCPNGPDTSTCLAACATWDRPICVPWIDLQACAGRDPQIVCVSDGPYIVGCDEELQRAQSCSGIPADAGITDAGAPCDQGTYTSCGCSNGEGVGKKWCLPNGHLGPCTC